MLGDDAGIPTYIFTEPRVGSPDAKGEQPSGGPPATRARGDASGGQIGLVAHNPQSS